MIEKKPFESMKMESAHDRSYTYDATKQEYFASNGAELGSMPLIKRRMMDSGRFDAGLETKTISSHPMRESHLEQTNGNRTSMNHESHHD